MMDRYFTVERLSDEASITAEWGGRLRSTRPATHLLTAYENGKIVFQVAHNDPYGAFVEIEAEALRRRGFALR